MRDRSDISKISLLELAREILSPQLNSEIPDIKLRSKHVLPTNSVPKRDLVRDVGDHVVTLSTPPNKPRSIFISWSGSVSHQIALLLHEWLPIINQCISPWLSSEDIHKGSQWIAQLNHHLSDACFGIICADPSNLHSNWLHYEAGALANALNHDCVAPFLLGLSPNQLSGPLTHFQATLPNESDCWKLVNSINVSLRDSQTPLEHLRKVYKIAWPYLHEKLESISTQIVNGS